MVKLIILNEGGAKSPAFLLGKIPMQLKHPLQDLLEPVIDGLGYELVRLLTIGQKNPTLQIMIDRKDGTDINVDDCATVSRAISAVMDEKDPIDDQYSLEVSSPGLDRPLTKVEHFKKFLGYETKIETGTEVSGRKRFKGQTILVDDKNNITIVMEGQEYVIPFEEINKAKIVLTNELLAEYMAAHSEEDDVVIEE